MTDRRRRPLLTPCCRVPPDPAVRFGTEPLLELFGYVCPSCGNTWDADGEPTESETTG